MLGVRLYAALPFHCAEPDSQKAVNLTTGVRISADYVAAGDPVRICIRTAREIDQNTTSIPGQKTMLLSVRSVDAADHIASRVHAAEKYVTVAGTTDRIVNPAAEQETLEHSVDRVAAYDALARVHRCGDGLSAKCQLGHRVPC